MKAFEFSDFVEEFKVPFTYIEKNNGGHWQAGEWVKGTETRIKMYGIVLPLSEDDLQYAEAGTYRAKDKKIYTTQPLQLNAEVEYKGDRYTIQNFKDYSEYADVYIYYARWREK